MTARNQLAPHMVRQPSMMSFCSLSRTKVQFNRIVKCPTMRSFVVLEISYLVAWKNHHLVCDLLRPSELYFICDVLFYSWYMQLTSVWCKHLFLRLTVEVTLNLFICSFSLWIVVQTDYPWAGLNQRYLYTWGTGELN